jgi:hypothetical protein
MAVQAKLRAGLRADDDAKRLYRLCGLTSISGFVVDERLGDIILVGRCEAGQPALHLDDLVVALRNVWLRYADRKGAAIVYEPPGCSIDPDPPTMRRLDALYARAMRQGKAARRRRLAEYRTVAQSPQKVRIMGMPFRCRFGRVLVDADYHMKRVSDGSAKTEVPGLQSMTEVRLARSKARLLSDDPYDLTSSGSLDRFWFTSGGAGFVEDAGVAMLDTCTVKLLTEAEALRGGRIVGTGTAGKTASDFASAFTRHYDAVAARHPIYTELRSLFRMVALAKMINLRPGSLDPKRALAYLLDAHPIAEADVPRAMPGLSRVVELERKRPIDGGYEIRYAVHATCGGVAADVDISDRTMSHDTSGRLGAASRGVLSSRPAGDVVTWECPVLTVGARPTADEDGRGGRAPFRTSALLCRPDLQSLVECWRRAIGASRKCGLRADEGA